MIVADRAPVRPRGHFVLDVFERGRLVEHYAGTNLVVAESSQILANALGGATGGPVSQIAFGSNGTAPSSGDTAIANQFAKAVDSVIYPGPNQVQFNFSLLSTEDNGATIWEFGLLSGGGLLFARKVRSSGLSKTNQVSLSGSWIITF